MGDSEWVLPIIKRIEDRCLEGNLHPVCAPYVEIERECTAEQRKSLREALNQLYVDGKIRVWRAINDKMVKSV